MPDDAVRFDQNQYYRLMSMMYNLYYSHKRLARRLVRLRRELEQAQPAVRERVISEGTELLKGRLSAELVVHQTRQHWHLAVRGARAYEAIFDEALG